MEKIINNTENKTNTDASANINIRKRYSAILADPAWKRNQTGVRGAASHYAVMPTEQIKTMPVADLAEDNAHLYLWCPNGLLEDALEVIRAWGFVYRSMLVWVKPRLGLGVYVRNAHETLLFATRGKAPVKFHSQPSWLFAPFQPPHSHKPEEVFSVIERMSDGPYLELFARRRQPGWDVWGNEIDSDIIIPDYPVPHYSAKALRKEV